MQATLTRPNAAQNAFFAHTGVPLGPLPMNADVPDPVVLVLHLHADGNEPPVPGPGNIDEVLAARCCSL